MRFGDINIHPGFICLEERLLGFEGHRLKVVENILFTFKDLTLIFRFFNLFTVFRSNCHSYRLEFYAYHHGSPGGALEQGP